MAENEHKDKKQNWFKRFGTAAIVFFLVKGIIWLLLFWGVFKFCE